MPLDLLSGGDLRPLGRLVQSSNNAVLMEVGSGADRVLAIHKPIAFERPLWDYPDGHLAHRECAAYLISEAGDFATVPPTVLRDGPWGPGSLQLWIGDPAEEVDLAVTVCAPGEAPEGWLVVLTAEDEDGEEVVLAHSSDSGVRTAAVLDAVLNNSDRKGGHLAVVADGVRGFDHGVSLGVEPKLRTVLWGWTDEPLLEADLDRVRHTLAALDDDGPLRADLADLLTAAEIDALQRRCRRLLSVGRHPRPAPDWPAIPWPAM